MAYTFPEGSAFYFSSTFAATKTISALTNANPAVATSTAHGYVDDDIVLVSSGWEDATDSLYKVNQTATDTFELLGLNASSTSFFPAGSGTGTASLVSSWVSIPQILSVSTQGGDARFTQVNLLARRNATQVPTGFNPASMTLSLAFDPSNANYITMLDLSRGLTPVAFKMVLSGGAMMLAYGYMSVSEVPSLNVNQVNAVNCSLTFLNKPISYAS
jgi:hypothetical protein